MKFSYSSIATYKQCPAKFNFAYIEKAEAPDLPPSPALERGTKIHDSIESYMNRTTEFMHPEIHEQWGQYMHGIREGGGTIIPELKWGITWDFQPCDYDYEMCMFRGFVDLLVVPDDTSLPLDQYEWKTGKKYDTHTDQTCKYATGMLLHYPEREIVDSMTVYIDGHPHTNIKYHRMMLNDYLHMLRRDIDTILTDKYMVTKPSFKCRWCKFSRQHNGGPCPVG